MSTRVHQILTQEHLSPRSWLHPWERIRAILTVTLVGGLLCSSVWAQSPDDTALKPQDSADALVADQAPPSAATAQTLMPDDSSRDVEPQRTPEELKLQAEIDRVQAQLSALPAKPPEPTVQDIGDPPPSLEEIYPPQARSADQKACRRRGGKWSKLRQFEGCAVKLKRVGRWISTSNQQENIELILHFKDNQIDGPYWEFNPQGKAVGQGHFVKHKRQGTFRKWGSGGQLVSVTHYHNDLREGSYFFWNQDACTPLAAGAFLKDERHGMWREWHDNGVVESEGGYLAGAAQGRWSFHHPEGNKTREGVFLNNLEEGVWREWLHTGQKWRDVRYKSGSRQGEDEQACAQLGGEWEVDHKERFETCIKRGLIAGGAKKVLVYKTYYESGALKRRLPLDQNSIAQGTERRYHPTGELLVSGELRGGIPDGTFQFLTRSGAAMGIPSVITQGTGRWRAYHHNGKVAEEGDWMLGAKVGTWFTYYDHGGVESEISYDLKKLGGGWRPASSSDLQQANPLTLMYHFISDLLCVWTERECPKPSGRKQGLAKYYYRDGTIKRAGRHERGMRDGMWKFYYQNGQVAYEVGFDVGQRSGVWREWHWLSSPKVDGTYKDGKRTGTWREFHNNGVVSATGDYRSDKKQGDWEQTWYSGSFWRRLTYDKGMSPDQLENQCRDDLSGTWDANLKKREVGCMVCRVSAESGNKKLRVGRWRWWHPNGQIEREGDFELGEAHGIWRQYNHEGKLTLEGTYERGKRIGLWRGFYPSGALQYEGRFNEEGGGEGEWVTYREGQSVESRGIYQEGARTGLWGWWHADGSSSQIGRFIKREALSGLDQGRTQKSGVQGAQTKRDQKDKQDERGAQTKRDKKDKQDNPEHTSQSPDQSKPAPAKLSLQDHKSVRDGVWLTWYPQCQFKVAGRYKRGQREGLWRWWRAEGEGWRAEWYVGGRRVTSLSPPDPISSEERARLQRLCRSISSDEVVSETHAPELTLPKLGKLTSELQREGLIPTPAQIAPSDVTQSPEPVPVTPRAPSL